VALRLASSGGHHHGGQMEGDAGGRDPIGAGPGDVQRQGVQQTPEVSSSPAQWPISGDGGRVRVGGQDAGRG
jgi:hypothetical protein